jgi:hypothetical protein
MEAVRFLKDQNTVGSFEVLSFGDTGTLNLTLTGNPVIITPSSTIDILDAFDLPPVLAFTLNGTLTSQIVYALVDPLPPGDSAYSYRWYLDGDAQTGELTGATADRYTVNRGSFTIDGNHNLSVLVDTDADDDPAAVGALSSETITFYVDVP